MNNLEKLVKGCVWFYKVKTLNESKILLDSLSNALGDCEKEKV